MKYGIRNRSLNMEWKDALMAAGEIGYDGVELVVPLEEDIARLLTPSGRDEVLSWCEESNCAVSSLSVAPFRRYSFGLPDADMDASVRFVSDCLRVCAALGAAGVLLPHFDRENIDVSAAAEVAFIGGFKRCAPVAEELKVYATLETSFSVEQLQRIVDAVDSPYVGVYQDVANALHYGHEPVDMLTRLGKRISMIHIKDKGGELLGEGEVDWDKCIAAIKDIDYDGWLVLETRATDDPRRAASENLKFIRSAIQTGNFCPE
jgi:L-ribulose-5-phosphate 3-epimerase